MSNHLPDIIFENADFIVLDKPSGMLSIPDRMGKEISLKSLLQEKFGSIFTVHRLDKDTSGVIVFAKNEKTHKFLSQAFEGRAVQKYYLGIVAGTLISQKGTVDLEIMEHPAKYGVMIVNKKGKQSITDYEMLEAFGSFSSVQFQIHTGRTHQIRVHMQHLGHPIVCDEVYGEGKPVLLSSIKKKFKLSKSQDEERPMLQRLGLHAFRLQFTDEQGEAHLFEAPLPKDMKALLQQLRKWKA